MQTRTKADLHRLFIRGVLLIGAGCSVLFVGQFLFEFYRLGQPSMADMSWAGVNNAKLVDALSPMARAYNNVLAMLIATIGLAIPLTASMHTPKLIELFLQDRINRIVLTIMAVGAGNVLFVIYLIGPEFAPTWAYRVAIYGALLGWVLLLPYYFYVVRFLDPSNVIVRLNSDALETVVKAKRGDIPLNDAQAHIQERLFQTGTIVMKSIERADRSVVREGIWAFKQLIDSYVEHKRDMPDAWFAVDKADFVGMSSHGISLIAKKKMWLEMHVVYQLLLCYQHALPRAPDAVSAISNVNRHIAIRAARAGDTSVISMCIRFFNTFLREAINRGDARSAFDIFYQYRELAQALDTHPKFIGRIATFMTTYAVIAEQQKLRFVSDLAAFDLGHILEGAYEADLDVAEDVLRCLMEMPHHETDGSLRLSRVRAKLIAGGYFEATKREAQRRAVEDALQDVPSNELDCAYEHLAAIGKQQFFEITDRAVNIEWTDLGRRKHIRHFVARLTKRRKDAAQ